MIFFEVIFGFRQSIFVSLFLCSVVCASDDLSELVVFEEFTEQTMSIDPVNEGKVTLPPVKTECVQLIYLTKEGERYGLWCDLSPYTMCSTYGSCLRRVTVVRDSCDEFLRDTATSGWVLKKGFHCPREKWLQARDPWAFVGWYDLCPFYAWLARMEVGLA